jgi:hypothetical protein
MTKITRGNKTIINNPKNKKPEIQTNSGNSFDLFVNKYSFYIFLGLVFVIVIISMFDFLITRKLFFFKDIGSDTVNAYYPGIVQNINLQKEEFLPKWSFYYGLGQNSFNGIPLDPFGLISYLFFLIGGSTYSIIGFFHQRLLFTIIPSGILFFFYLRRLNIDKYTSVIGGMLLTFMGYMTLGSTWGYDGGVFIGVLLLLSFEELYIKKRWYFLPLAFYYLSRNPFHLYFYSLFIAIYALMRILTDDDFSYKKLITKYLQIFIYGCLGILINAINIISNYISVFQSPRVAGETSFTSSLSGVTDAFDQYNHNATAILRLFSNDILGTGTNFNGWYNYLEAPVFYCGLLTLLLIPQMFTNKNRKQLIIFGAYLVFWILPVLIPPFRYMLYLYMGDYYKEGLDFFIPVTFLFFALHALNTIKNEQKVNLLVLASTLVILLIALLFPYYSNGINPVAEGIRNFSAFLLIAYSGLIYLLTNPKYSNLSKIALLVLLSIELINSTSTTLNKRDAYSKREFKTSLGGYNDGSIDAINQLKANDKSFFRVEKDYSSGNAEHGSLNDAQAQGYFGTSNYSSFNQGNYIRFLRSMDVVKGYDISELYKLSVLSPDSLAETAFSNHLINKLQKELIKEGKLSLNQIILDKSVNLGIIPKDQALSINPSGFSKSDIDNILRAEARVVESTSRWAQGLKGRPLASTFVSVKYHLSKNANPLFLKFGYDSIGQSVPIKILKNKYHLPLGITYDTIISEKEFLKLSTFQKDIMVLRAAVINKNIDNNLPELTASDSLNSFDFPVYDWLIKHRRVDTLAIKEYSNSSFSGYIQVSKRKLLVLSFPFDAGWEAKLNGKPTALVVTNFGLTGLWIEAGNHQIELKYTPPYFNSGLSVSLVSILLYFVLIFIKWKPKEQ